MRACWREGITPLLQMHDCLDCSVSSREQAELVARLGEQAVTLDVPMRVDLKFGRSWGDATHNWKELEPAQPTPAATPDELADILDAAPDPTPEPATVVENPAGGSGDCTNKCAKCRPVSFVVFPEQVMTARDTALSLAAQGVHVFPAPPNTKKSYKSAAFNNDANWGMTNDPREVGRDFTRWCKAGVGLPTGKMNGIFVVEADRKDVDVNGIANLDALREQYGEFPRTPTAISPSGSTHYYFRHPGGYTCIQNSRSKLTLGVDVRGDGGMVIAPPTLRKDGQYRWVSGLIFEPPQWLLELVTTSPEVAPNPDVGASVASDGFERFADAEPIEKIEAALAVLDPRELGHDEHLKVACALFKALGDADGFNLLTDWLQRVPEYYDATLAKAQWRSVAAKNGYGYSIGSLYWLADLADDNWHDADTPRGGESADGSNEDAASKTNGGTRPKQPASPKGYGAAGSTLEIIEPVDLWGQFDPPLLPLGLLPDVIERFAFEEGELTGADPSGLAMAALAVCAAALPDHTQLKVKRHDPHWLEAARLWVGLIGNPSTKKTPIMLRVTKPLKRLDAALWRKFIAEKEAYDALSSEERKQAARPRQTRLRLEDTTIEAAQEVLKDSPDGVLCIQDELSGWFGAMDKYSGRGASKDRGFWLQSFHGGPYALNRIARGAAMIENLSVSLLGGIQPDPIRKIAEDTIDDGLLQRLLPTILRRGKAGKDAPAGQAALAYDDLIVRLHDHERPGTALEFDDAALAIREALERKHLDLMAYEVINKKLAAHIGKYDGLFGRLCLLWHCIEGAEGLTVTEHTARRVAAFMLRFLLPHATAFYAGMLTLSDDHDRLTNVAGYILAKKLTHITNRDVQRGSRAMRGLERQEIERIFEQLEALGWLTRVGEQRWSTPPRWRVNAEVHRLFAERAEREATERAKEREMLQEMFGTVETL
jgi:hypothetical protein